MKRVFASFVAFVFVQFMFCYVLWMGGFDFDKRTPIIGYLALVGLMAGGLGALFTYERFED